MGAFNIVASCLATDRFLVSNTGRRSDTCQVATGTKGPEGVSLLQQVECFPHVTSHGVDGVTVVREVE